MASALEPNVRGQPSAGCELPRPLHVALRMFLASFVSQNLFVREIIFKGQIIAFYGTLTYILLQTIGKIAAFAIKLAVENFLLCFYIPQDFPAHMHNSVSSDEFRPIRGPSSGSAHILKSACI